jgi:hypothetical protein
MRLGRIATMILLISSGLAHANELPPAQPLFDSNEILHLEIQLPFTQLEKDRKGKPEYFPAQLAYLDADGQPVTVDIDLRTRGKMRRKAQTCKFPPLKMRLHKSNQAHLFKNQKTLKLVTHCQDKNINDQYVLKEYLAYRIYNLLTDYSIRARLVKVSYLEGEKLIAQRYAIILEHWKMVAARTGTTKIKTEGRIDIGKLSNFETSLMALFQYMIGNDDWSALWPAADEECCHNMRHVLTTDGKIMPLPYDFDFSGLVDTTYAVSRLGTSNVRKRRYLGYCESQVDLADAITHVQSRREEIDAQVRQLEALSSRENKRTLKYFDRFYEVLNDPKKFEKRILKRCRE